MDPDFRPVDTEAQSFRVGMVLLVILIIGVAAVQMWAGLENTSQTETSDNTNVLIVEDYVARRAIASSSSEERIFGFNLALQIEYPSYQKSPAYYRRRGVMKQSVSKKDGLSDFKKIDSPAATRGLSKEAVNRLRVEKTMWLRIYGPEKISDKQAKSYAKEIRDLNLGPLKDLAMSDAYRRAGLIKQADKQLKQAQSSARITLVATYVVIGVLFTGGLVGLILLLFAVPKWLSGITHSSRYILFASITLPAFLIYLATYYGLSGLVQIAIDPFTGSIEYIQQGTVLLSLSIGAALVAGAIGFSVLRKRAGELNQDWRQIGFRTQSFTLDIGRGLVGFMIALPLVLFAAQLSQKMSSTIFKNIPTPQQPFQDIIDKGSALEIALMFILASVVAPVVEETFFRGTLFSAFRARMGVLPSVLLCSVFFAFIHPLPGGFLPIFALACVLALLREQSGSLLPGMICHSIYNAMTLALTYIFF